MNTTRDFVRTSMPVLPTARAYPTLPRSNAPHLSRAGFPVVSNRAFINAWTARRSKLVASAQIARGN